MPELPANPESLTASRSPNHPVDPNADQASLPEWSRYPAGGAGFSVVDYEPDKQITGINRVADDPADLNGDGIDDLILSKKSVNGAPEAAFVVFGSKTPFPSTFRLMSLDGICCRRQQMTCTWEVRPWDLLSGSARWWFFRYGLALPPR